MNFWTWFRQPSTISGIGAALGTITGAVANVVSGHATVGAAVAAVTYSAVNLAVNDSTVATDAGNLVGTGVQAASGGVPGLVDSAPTLVGDMFGLLNDLVRGNVPPPAAVTPVSTSGPTTSASS